MGWLPAGSWLLCVFPAAPEIKHRVKEHEWQIMYRR